MDPTIRRVGFEISGLGPLGLRVSRCRLLGAKVPAGRVSLSTSFDVFFFWLF